MWLRHLEIHHLRNLSFVALDLGAGLNYFCGENGAGKTAVLEAVHLLARGRSFRTHQAADLIQHGESATTVHTVALDEHRGEQSLGVTRGRTGRAELRVNGRPGRRLSEIASLVPLQVMVPSLSDLVFGPPGGRRQWLDWGLFHVEPDYLATLRGYLHALRQRNAALKACAAGELGLDQVAIWSQEMGRLGETVTERRMSYVDRLRPVLEDVIGELAPELPVEVAYWKGWASDHPLPKVLGESGPREVKLGISQNGPHRGDIGLRVSGVDAGSSLSRGQGKSLASALMLAQAKLLRQSARRSSIFLIDDIGAELDLPHSERFFRSLTGLGTQVLATSNGGLEVAGDFSASAPVMFHVEHGRIRKIDSG